MATPNGAQSAVAAANAAAPAAGGAATDPNPAATGPTPAGQGGGGGGAAAVKEFKYTEDRSDWLPRHRLSEETGKRTEAEKQRDQLKTALELAEKRTRALAGLDPKDPQAEERAEIKNVLTSLLKEILPGLEDISQLKPGELKQALGAASSGATAAQQYHARHRDDMYTRVESEAVKTLGVEKLSERQTRSIRNAFRDEFAEAYQKREALVEARRESEIDENDFVGRYLKGDPQLIVEFVKNYLGDWVDSARRQATANTVRRQGRPVPSGGRGETVITKALPDADLSTDEGFKKAIVAARQAGQ